MFESPWAKVRYLCPSPTVRDPLILPARSGRSRSLARHGLFRPPRAPDAVRGLAREAFFKLHYPLLYLLRFADMSPLTDTVVHDIVRRIVDTVQPEKVILFGSQARGDARPNSDYDVLVIKHSDEPRYRRSAPLYVALADLPVEVEVMVYTPEEVHEWSEVPQAFVTTAVREGTTIYERRR